MSGNRKSYWSAYLDPPPDFRRFPPGGTVVDIGCGHGEHLARIREMGCRPIGLEVMPEAAREARRLGYPVVIARAEALPFRRESCQGILCKVVIPYTDERETVAEFGRVLGPGGVAIISLHGLGYSLRYLLWPEEWRRVVYAIKTIVNTLVYRAVGRRLPGSLGDTIFQSPGRMRRYYRVHGLELDCELDNPRFLGTPVFIGHVLRK